MKIYTEIVIDMTSGEIEWESSYDYEGPIAECGSSGGGDTIDKEYNDRLASVYEAELEMSQEMQDIFYYGTPNPVLTFSGSGNVGNMSEIGSTGSSGSSGGGSTTGTGSGNADFNAHESVTGGYYEGQEDAGYVDASGFHPGKHEGTVTVDFSQGYPEPGWVNDVQGKLPKGAEWEYQNYHGESYLPDYHAQQVADNPTPPRQRQTKDDFDRGLQPNDPSRPGYSQPAASEQWLQNNHYYSRLEQASNPGFQSGQGGAPRRQGQIGMNTKVMTYNPKTGQLE